ncbi:DNA adenine methylase [Brevibacillus agri]|uniref:DNA adenine methylase n=1 Tax=Brevibacillus agri TaxID=51101 RepID=UPI002867E1FE|nr:DNA adenine methylase [Brevibacillus agri]
MGLITKYNEDMWQINLDYDGENNVASFINSNSNIHPYPAKAVPEVVNSLLLKIMELKNVRTVLDPFVGSGTVALESKYLGLDFYGSDLNPLSVLISRTKSLTVPNSRYVEKQLRKFTKHLVEEYSQNRIGTVESFYNITYWFKEANIKQLSYIKQNIDLFLRKTTKKTREAFSLILLTAFSSTIRCSSLTRNGEFKLYRMSPADIEKHNIDSIELFKSNVEDLLDLLEHTKQAFRKDTTTGIFLENAKSLSYLENKKVDVILTSPPYGDSQSTVAYGQFSRLSLQWMSDLLYKYLGINVNYENCDPHLLGGHKSKIGGNFHTVVSNSKILSNLINEMNDVIQSEISVFKKSLNDLLLLAKLGQDKKFPEIKNEVLLELIQERIRLEVYRKLNQKGTISNKKTKKLAKQASEIFVRELFDSNLKKRYRRIVQLEKRIPILKEILSRKIKAQPKRINEVISFFQDLYQVILETDRVLENGGVQAWIVGHRTVLGKVTINMVGILQDWFESMGYAKITTLERQYSHKRLPHHINSTVTRLDEIKTMMQEHILVVMKRK